MNGIEISLGKDQQLAVFDKDGKELARVLGKANQVVKVSGEQKPPARAGTTEYSYSEFVDLVCRAVKEHTGAVVGGVNVDYPTDYRCAFRLCVFLKLKSGEAYTMYDTTKIDRMRELFNDNSIVSVMWPRNPDKYVIIVRDEKEDS